MKILSIIILLEFIHSFRFVNSQSPDTVKAEDILNMSLADLMNLKVVSATKFEQPLRSVSANMQVITAEQIKTCGYITLEEVLSDLPGFQFRNILGFNSYVFLRGAPSQNNLILLMIDGIQMNELNSGGFYGGGQFILPEVERIEILYGPASALYGTNAVSGIINLITKKPSEKSASAGISCGSFNTGILNMNFKNCNSSGDFGYSVTGQYKTSEKANLRGENGDNNWTDEMENFENDLSFAARLKYKKFNAGVDYQEKRSSMTTNFRSVNDRYLDKNTLWDIIFLNAYLKYTYDTHRKWSVYSTAYYRDATVKPNTVYAVIKATDTTLGQQIRYYRPNRLFGIENQVNLNFSDNIKLISGIIGETESLSDGYSITYSNSQDELPVTPPRPPILNNYLFSYYSQFNSKISKFLSFNLGFRHDFSDYYGNVFIPRSGVILSYKDLIVKALFNQAFRAPKPWDYKYGAGNPHLKPEKMRSLEFCASFLVNKNIDVGGSVYFNKIKDIMVKERIGNSERWVNSEMLKTIGVEFYWNYVSNNINLYANYTYNNSLNINDIQVPEISKHTANAGITITPVKKLKINLRANYLGDRQNPNIIPAIGSNEIEDALIFNGCVSYSFLKELNLCLKVNNIFNKEYYHPSNRFDGRYRQPQRGFYIMFSYDFNLKK